MTTKLFGFVLVSCLVAVSGRGSSKSGPSKTKDVPGGAFDKERESCYHQMKECCPTLPRVTLNGTYESCKNKECKVDCAYEASGLLEADKKSVNLGAVNARLDELAKDAAWTAAINEAKTACTATAPVVPPEKKCTTGSKQVNKCLMRSLVEKCPGGLSDQCKQKLAEMKAKHAKRAEEKKAKMQQKTAQPAPAGSG